MNDKIVKILLKELNKAYKENEFPVSCVITKDNKIIAYSHNQKEKNHNCLDHAELIAIKLASKKIKNWRLDNCIMYVTLKPCQMCENAILQSRIKEVYYIVPNNYDPTINGKVKIEQINISREIFLEINNKLKDVFKKKRTKVR